MPRLKAGLVVAIFALVLPDWLRLHSERQQAEDNAERAVELAEWKGQQVETCMSTLQVCKEGMGPELHKAQMIVLIQAQTASLVRAAQNGDREATTRLAELGWSWDTNRRVLQASLSGE